MAQPDLPVGKHCGIVALEAPLYQRGARFLVDLRLGTVFREDEIEGETALLTAQKHNLPIFRECVHAVPALINPLLWNERPNA